MRHSFGFLIALIFALILAGLLGRHGDLIAMALPLMAYLASAIWFAPEQPQLQATRRLSTDKASEGTPVKVHIQVSNQGPLVEEFYLKDHLPAGALLQDGKNEHLGLLMPGETVTMEYQLAARRGRYTFDQLISIGMDPFGVFTVDHRLPASASLLVYPGMADLPSIPLHPPNTKGFSGPIASRKSGTGMNFYGVREYQQGDPLRRINWKMSARHDLDLFTNEFEQERIADIGLILDARQQYNILSGNRQIFEYSIIAAASLAKTFLDDGHCLSLVTFGAGVARVFPGYGKVQRERILKALAHARTGFNFALDNLGNLPTRLLSPHGQLVYISPISREDIQPLLRFHSQGYDVLVVSPDPIRFELSREADGALPDWELAARFARLERGLLFKQLERAGIHLVDWDVDLPLAQAIEGVKHQLPIFHRSIRVLV